MNNNPSFDYKSILKELGYSLYDSCGCGGTHNDKFKKGNSELIYQPKKMVFIHKINGKQVAFKNSSDFLEYSKLL
jgi:hypothetical protein